MSVTSAEVREIIHVITGRAPDRLDPRARLADLGLDSVDRVTLAVMLEARFGSAVPDHALARMDTLADIEQALAAVPPPQRAPQRGIGGTAERAPSTVEGETAARAFTHSTADVAASARVGERTHLWHEAQVADGVRIGRECVLGKGVYVGSGSVLGDRVKLQNGCGVFGARLEDEVMLAPGVYLLEDAAPRAVTSAGVPKGPDDWTRRPVTVRRGATVGANAVVAPGVTIGRWALVAIGAAVTRDVADHALVAGNPARQVGWVCRCGEHLDSTLSCGACQATYSETDNGLSFAKQADAATLATTGRLDLPDCPRSAPMFHDQEGRA